MKSIHSVSFHRFVASVLGVGVLAASSLACSAGPEAQDAVTTSEARTTTIQGAITVWDWSSLPVCTLLRRATVFYVTASQNLVYCDGSQYLPVPLTGLNGKDGRDGVNYLVTITPATLQECATGG